MRVRVSKVETCNISHPHFGQSYVCITPEVLGITDKIFPNRHNGLAGVIEVAETEGVMPYCAGDNLFYVGVKMPHEKRIRRLSWLDGNGTIIAAPLEEHGFKRLLGIFVLKYIQQMHS